MKISNKINAIKDFLYFLVTGIYYFLSVCLGFIKMKALKEYGALLVMVTLFFCSSYVLRWIDPTAGIFDAGILQIINLSLVQFAVITTVIWTWFKFIWPDLGHFMKFHFKDNFKLLTPWQKISLSVSVFCFFFLMLVLLNKSI